MDQYDYIKILRGAISLKNRDVLEVGGATPPSQIAGSGARSWTSIDITARRFELSVKNETVPSWHKFHTMDAAQMTFPDASFDVIYSANCFEHITSLPEALRHIHRVLRPSGKLFTIFSPIWTSPVGHHTWVWDGNRPLTFSEGVFPDWYHLLLSRAEMEEWLRKKYSSKPALVDKILQYVYDSQDINRFPDSLYETELAKYNYGRILFHRIQSGAPSAELLARLRERHPEVRDFRTLGYFLILSKGNPALTESLRAYVGGGAQVAMRRVAAKLFPRPREE